MIMAGAHLCTDGILLARTHAGFQSVRAPRPRQPVVDTFIRLAATASCCSSGSSGLERLLDLITWSYRAIVP